MPVLLRWSSDKCSLKRRYVGPGDNTEEYTDLQGETPLSEGNMETQPKETGERYNRPQGSFWNLCCLFIRGCRRKTEDAVAGKPLTITTTPVGSLVRGSLSNSVTGGSMRNPLSSDRTALNPKTNKHQWMSVLKRRRSMLSDNCINEFPSREDDTVSQLLTKAQITSPKTTTVTNNLKNHGSPSCLVRKDLKHGTFNVVSLEGEHLHESAVNKADPIGLITQAAVAAASRPSSNGEELPNGLHQKLPTTEECQLISYIELCERRVERLHNMISGLQKEKNALPTTLTQQVKKRVMSIIRPAETTTRSRDSLPQYRKEVAISLSEMEKVEQKMYRISERIRELKFQLESYAYLSWLGLTPETQQSRVAIPGRYAPMPNPQLHMIRRTDSECRMTIQEYNRLCQSPISEKVQIELRKATFNNWPWSEAWLIRFVRQMFVDLGLVTHFKLQLAQLDKWLCDVYRRYNRVPFHNYLHAFMVCQMAYAILWAANLAEILDKEEQLIILVSAICHDLDHPGFNNAYQINAGTELAMRYNDQSPLENHHASMAFDILSQEDTNPFAHLGKATFKRIREGIIRCILATDMSRHNDILSQFNDVILMDLETAWRTDPETNLPVWSSDKTRRDLVMMIYIKVCDISNECRPLNVAGPWINRLLSEFFHQSDYEKLVGLPVAPFMDREKVTKAASQCGFIRFVILPLFEAFAKLFPPLKEAIVQPAHEQLSYYTELSQQELSRTAGEADESADESQN